MNTEPTYQKENNSFNNIYYLIMDSLEELKNNPKKEPKTYTDFIDISSCEEDNRVEMRIAIPVPDYWAKTMALKTSDKYELNVDLLDPSFVPLCSQGYFSLDVDKEEFYKGAKLLKEAKFDYLTKLDYYYTARIKYFSGLTS